MPSHYGLGIGNGRPITAQELQFLQSGQPQGGLSGYAQGVLNNPLFHAGIGILGAGGSLQGLGQGLQGFQQQQQGQQRFALQNALLQERLNESARKRESEEQALRAAQARREQLGGFLRMQGLDRFLPLLGTSAEGDLVKALVGQEFPEEDAFTQKARALEQRLGRPLEEPEILMMGSAAQRQSPVTVITGDQGSGEITSRPLRPEEVGTFGINPEDAQEYIVGAKGDLKLKPQTPAGQLRARTAESFRGLDEFVAQYEEAAKAYNDQPLPVGPERDIAESARDALIAWIAKNVLGTPGAEPSPVLYEKAADMVPDYAGPYDSRVFGKRMIATKRQARSRLEAKGKAGAAPLPQGEIQEEKQSKNGNTYIKIDGLWYLKP